MIGMKNIYYSYDSGAPALKNVSLKIMPGESVAFIGPNGSGKSTLMKLINGLVSPSSGSYSFEDLEITSKYLKNDLLLKSFHKKIGFVFQNSEVQLFCSNVYEEIAFGVRQMGMPEGEVQEKVEDILKLLKVEHLKHRQPYHLSGGEKRKIAIASVLVMNPQVLVFDEPMNGLDPESKRFLRELMISLNEAGKTILCSTHDFEYVKDVFKRVVVFSKDHTIIRDGSYKEIMEDKEFLIKNNII
ncbi:energy-coupling factor ABC transporter ATP-binding protein [Clostridium bowmanii]|uniref:energy-coupling factor ABC transporter ATP-binding protein n=1 Tax=Clostridium bowmanii TaxID=132925 RepID=UPI001C0D71BD|nr:ABC transporter ATP-binding protein [Clostridium bowmanii]MBU3188509.1 energy-coupling factor ABC transporter ATP-binding protein [Clostridium bowmanii]MCA1072893.1 energy-coupling factor ABC transporter ATP-binding protein [Clostridium bowmanii]